MEVSNIDVKSIDVKNGIFPLFREPEEALSAVLQMPHAKDRALTESFIRSTYEKSFGARINQFNPWLLSVRTSDSIWGAAGIRGGDHRVALFSEQYLDAPVEEVLEKQLGHRVKRRTIAEIGNLATLGRGKSRYLILAITALLKATGFDWAFCTAVSPLYQVFLRVGLNPIPLAIADPSRLGEKAHAWGSYYTLNPLVCVLDVNRVHALFDGVINARQVNLARFWQQSQQLSSVCTAPHQSFA